MEVFICEREVKSLPSRAILDTVIKLSIAFGYRWANVNRNLTISNHAYRRPRICYCHNSIFLNFTILICNIKGDGVFFFVQGEERMHLRTLCETRPKQYPLISKLPCFLASQWPWSYANAVLGSLSIGAIHRDSASTCSACMYSLRGLFKASYLL